MSEARMETATDRIARIELAYTRAMEEMYDGKLHGVAGYNRLVGALADYWRLQGDKVEGVSSASVDPVVSTRDHLYNAATTLDKEYKAVFCGARAVEIRQLSSETAFPTSPAADAYNKAATAWENMQREIEQEIAGPTINVNHAGEAY